MYLVKRLNKTTEMKITLKNVWNDDYLIYDVFSSYLIYITKFENKYRFEYK